MRVSPLFSLPDQLCERHAQRTAALVTLVAHDDRYKLEVAQHPLQPGQLALQVRAQRPPMWAYGPARRSWMLELISASWRANSLSTGIAPSGVA